LSSRRLRVSPTAAVLQVMPASLTEVFSLHLLNTELKPLEGVHDAGELLRSPLLSQVPTHLPLFQPSQCPQACRCEPGVVRVQCFGDPFSSHASIVLPSGPKIGASLLFDRERYQPRTLTRFGRSRSPAWARCIGDVFAMHAVTCIVLWGLARLTSCECDAVPVVVSCSGAGRHFTKCSTK
jgi:hypothetical protein